MEDELVQAARAMLDAIRRTNVSRYDDDVYKSAVHRLAAAIEGYECRPLPQIAYRDHNIALLADFRFIATGPSMNGLRELFRTFHSAQMAREAIDDAISGRSSPQPVTLQPK